MADGMGDESGDRMVGGRVEFVDPRAEPGRPVEPYVLRLDAAAGPLEIGLLANGFPDSEVFLDHVEKALAATLPAATFHRYNKHNASSVITDDMLDSVVAECGAVVAAYGH